ncbi:MAG: hypothetical protein WCE44_07085 [Candidatus Velthaea sp.]
MKAVALLLAVVFFVIAILYLTGHGYPAGVHYKHAILAFVLAVLSLVWFRFVSSPASSSR